MTTQNITTLKELRKQLGTIDLSQVRFATADHFYWGGYYFDLDEPLKPRRVDGKPYLPAFNTDIDGCNPSIDLGCKYSSARGSTYGFVGGQYEHLVSRYDYKTGEDKQVRGRKHYRQHFLFSETTISLRGGKGKNKDQIVRVSYAKDNSYLENWLRNKLDPSIENNWDDLHSEKQFKVCITTTRLEKDYEYVEVTAATAKEALQMLRDKDPLLDVTDIFDPYSGMKTSECLTRKHPNGTDHPDPKPVPQSYEEWVSLNEGSKQVA